MSSHVIGTVVVRQKISRIMCIARHTKYSEDYLLGDAAGLRIDDEDAAIGLRRVPDECINYFGPQLLRPQTMHTPDRS